MLEQYLSWDFKGRWLPLVFSNQSFFCFSSWLEDFFPLTWKKRCSVERKPPGDSLEGKGRETGIMMELRIQLIPTGEIILPPGKNGENYCNSCKVSSHTVTRARWGSAPFFTLASGLQTDADTAEVTGFISLRAEAEEHSHTLVIRSHGRQIELNEASCELYRFKSFQTWNNFVLNSLH